MDVTSQEANLAEDDSAEASTANALEHHLETLADLAPRLEVVLLRAEGTANALEYHRAAAARNEAGAADLTARLEVALLSAEDIADTLEHKRAGRPDNLQPETSMAGKIPPSKSGNSNLRDILVANRLQLVLGVLVALIALAAVLTVLFLQTTP
jgi:hypothetical protein